MWFLLRIFSLLSLVQSAEADCIPNKFFDLYVTTGYKAPDFGQNRVVVQTSLSSDAVTATIPGPEIRAQVDDCVQVNVHNDMYEEAVSVHYHGITQNGTPWADGTSFFSECPGQGGSVVPHVFRLDKAGTYLYHSHLANQMADGLYGPLIVDDPTLLNAVSNSVCFPPGGAYCISNSTYHDVTVVLSDWWPEDSRVQTAKMTNKPFVWQGEPPTILINGISSPNSTATGAFSVSAGHSYRLRLICASTLSYLRWSIEGHNVTVVAIDGMYVQPKSNLPYIECAPGQRYDVILKADQSPAAYWMIATPRYRAVIGFGKARVMYDTGPGGRSAVPVSNATTIVTAIPPSVAATNVTNLNDIKTASLAAVPASAAFVSQFEGMEAQPKKQPTVSLHYALSQQLMTRDGRTTYTPYNAATQTFSGNKTAPAYLRWAMNNLSYALEDTPVLLASYTGLYNREYQPHPLTVTIQSGDYVQIILQNGLAQNGKSENHPYHLHGHSFWIVGAGIGTYNATIDAASLDAILAPPYRDTITVLPYSWVAIRFVADNPGVWPFHCHISAHFSLLGMGSVFIETPAQIPAPPNGTAVCGRVAATFEDKTCVKLQSGYYADHQSRAPKV